MNKNNSRKKLFISKILPIIIFITLGAYWIRKIAIKWDKKSTKKVVHLDKIAQVPQFNLIERSGKKFSLHSLKGQIWVANFIATHTTQALAITNQMASIQQEFKAYDNVKLVSISADPERDTKKVLTQFANKSLASKRWFFLTGNKNSIYRLANELNLSIIPPDDKNQVKYSTKLILVDRSGYIRGYFDGADNQSYRKLVISIRSLLSEKQSD